MKCPYCYIGVKLDIKEQFAYADTDYSITNLGKEFIHGICPECKNLVVMLKIGKYRWVDDKGEVNEVQQELVIYPKTVLRIIEPRIPEEYRNAFNEANSVLSVSTKASAALSRRLLQQTLRDKYGIEKHDLSKQIDEFINLPNMPIEISGAVDAIRNVGNFAAHPLKYTNTGEIVEIENGEAEWLLDVLEELFDFTFVKPEKAKTKKDELNSKLAALGKPPMK
jgi:hypothetical protein